MISKSSFVSDDLCTILCEKEPSTIKKENDQKWSFQRSNENTKENTESQYFEKTFTSLLQREQNNMIKEKIKLKNKRGTYNETDEKKRQKI